MFWHRLTRKRLVRFWRQKPLTRQDKNPAESHVADCIGLLDRDLKQTRTGQKEGYDKRGAYVKN